MNKNLKVAESRTGLGVFAQKNFKPEERIVEITGNILHWKTVLDIGGVVLDNTFRYDDEHYLSPDGIGNYFNHSCEPNAGVIKDGKKLLLKAIAPIKTGEHITFDYSTIVGADDTWKMRCHCGANTCRKRVTSFYKLPSKLQQKYLDLQIVPKYIINSK